MWGKVIALKTCKDETTIQLVDKQDRQNKTNNKE